LYLSKYNYIGSRLPNSPGGYKTFRTRHRCLKRGMRTSEVNFRSYLGTGRMEVFDAELWAIGIALQKSVTRAETLRAHGVMTVAIFSDSQAAIRRTAHLDPGSGQQLARVINEHARALRAHGIEVVVHWVPGHSGIPGKEEADRQANKA
jgi:ribonuclease HI